MGCVYLARNTINGKCYVGKTIKSLNIRKSWHKSTAARGEGWAFHRAIRKYGFESFCWEVLHKSNDDAELCRLECESIVVMNARKPFGYNLTDGGDGVVGRDAETSAKIVAFHTGRKRSAETKKRISESVKGMQRRLGAILSEETRRKISVSNTGKRVSVETKAKIGAFMAGKPKTPEQRKKMSEARKKWWANRKAKLNDGDSKEAV